MIIWLSHQEEYILYNHIQMISNCAHLYESEMVRNGLVKFAFQLL